MPRKNVEGPQSVRSLLARSPEIQEVSRRMASLALVQGEPDGILNVRQREQLRRAFYTAGDALGWTATVATSDNAVVEVSKDILKLAKGGAKFMASDLADELASKRTERVRLGEEADATRKLSEDPKTTYPAEITYSFTARDASQVLVTKVATLTVEDSTEALKSAETIEKTLSAKGKLTDLMIIALEQQQDQLEAMQRTLPDFVKSSHQLVGEVIANLQ